MTKHIEHRVRDAYQYLAAGQDGWINLRRLREYLTDIPRSELDRALRDMYPQPDVCLEPDINQKTLADADWAAAVRIGGEEKHLLSITKP